MDDEQYRINLKLLKKQDDDSRINNMSISQRLLFHGFLRHLMKISLRASGKKVYFLNKKINPPTGRPVIYTLTHVGHDDVSVVNEVIKQHYTVLLGDYDNMHVGIEGLILAINGVICFDMRSVQDRKRVIPDVIKCLEAGDNILCSMEAAWNISPNEIVYELFYGMLSAAIKSNAVIIPVGVERFTKNIWGLNAFDSFFDPCEYIKKYPTKEMALSNARDDLRQIMADLKFNLYFQKDIFPKIMTKRSEIGDYWKYKKWFEEDVLDGWFSVADIEEKKYQM